MKVKSVEIIGVNMQVSKEVKMAFNVAAEETGIMKRKIVADALTEWLIAHGYLDAVKKTYIRSER